MKKLLVGIAALGLIAVAGSLWWLYNSLDVQVATAIRRYGPEITGVQIRLSKAEIDPLNGKAALHSLVVGNPDGFKTKQALSLGEISMTLDIGSLTTNVIRIKELTLTKPEVTYEHASGGSNLDVLQRHIERTISQQGRDRKNPQDSGPSKKLIIEHLYMKKSTASVSTELLNGETVSIPIPDLHLQNIGKKSNGATAGEATRQILGSIIQQVGTAVASLGVNTVGNTIQKGVDTATKTIKDLLK